MGRNVSLSKNQQSTINNQIYRLHAGLRASCFYAYTKKDTLRLKPILKKKRVGYCNLHFDHLTSTLCTLAHYAHTHVSFSHPLSPILTRICGPDGPMLRGEESPYFSLNATRRAHCVGGCVDLKGGPRRDEPNTGW